MSLETIQEEAYNYFHLNKNIESLQSNVEQFQAQYTNKQISPHLLICMGAHYIETGKVEQLSGLLQDHYQYSITALLCLGAFSHASFDPSRLDIQDDSKYGLLYNLAGFVWDQAFLQSLNSHDPQAHIAYPFVRSLYQYIVWLLRAVPNNLSDKIIGADSQPVVDDSKESSSSNVIEPILLDFPMRISSLLYKVFSQHTQVSFEPAQHDIWFFLFSMNNMDDVQHFVSQLYPKLSVEERQGLAKALIGHFDINEHDANNTLANFKYLAIIAFIACAIDSVAPDNKCTHLSVINYIHTCKIALVKDSLVPLETLVSSAMELLDLYGNYYAYWIMVKEIVLQLREGNQLVANISQINDVTLQIDNRMRGLASDITFNKIKKSGLFWRQDTHFVYCALCKTEFAFARRRHHCRACGYIVCATCSTNQYKFATGNARVCDSCHNILAYSPAAVLDQDCSLCNSSFDEQAHKRERCVHCNSWVCSSCMQLPVGQSGSMDIQANRICSNCLNT